MQEVQELWVWSLCWEDLLEQEVITHSSIITWKIPWTEAWRATVHGFAKSRTCFLNTGFWGGLSFSIVYSLISHIHAMSLFLCFLLGSFDLCIWLWASIKPWLLYLCSIVWNQKAWYSSFALLSQDFFGYWGVFHASICFRIIYSSSVRNNIGNLIESALILDITLGSMFILAIFILLILEDSLSSLFCCCLQFLPSMTNSFPSTDIVPLHLDLFLGVLFFLMQL